MRRGNKLFDMCACVLIDDNEKTICSGKGKEKIKEKLNTQDLPSLLKYLLVAS